MQSSPPQAFDLADALLRFAPLVVGFGAPLWGVFLYRRRERAQQALTVADARVKEETAEEIASRRARDDRAAYLSELRGRIENLKSQLAELAEEREAGRQRERMYELQLKTLSAQKVCAEERARELEDELGESRRRPAAPQERGDADVGK